jgi:hypothetical protein
LTFSFLAICLTALKSFKATLPPWVISLNLVLAGLRLGLKNRQVGEK